jgi:hypothetical protein
MRKTGVYADAPVIFAFAESFAVRVFLHIPGEPGPISFIPAANPHPDTLPFLNIAWLPVNGDVLNHFVPLFFEPPPPPPPPPAQPVAEIVTPEKEDFDSTENHFNESNWLTLQSEFDVVIRIELGAIIKDNDEFDWKFKS